MSVIEQALKDALKGGKRLSVPELVKATGRKEAEVKATVRRLFDERVLDKKFRSRPGFQSGPGPTEYWLVTVATPHSKDKGKARSLRVPVPEPEPPAPPPRKCPAPTCGGHLPSAPLDEVCRVRCWRKERCPGHRADASAEGARCTPRLMMAVKRGSNDFAFIQGDRNRPLFFPEDREKEVLEDLRRFTKGSGNVWEAMPREEYERLYGPLASHVSAPKAPVAQPGTAPPGEGGDAQALSKQNGSAERPTAAEQHVGGGVAR